MRHYLKRGTKVKEYTVVAKLGEGASCVAYSCVDSSDRNVILKEYYPLALKLDRNDSNSIVCDEKELERFNQGLERYKQSIERQIKFRSGMGGDNNIVNQIFDVSDQFAWNGTYYAVMTAYTGKNFSQIESMPLYDRIRVCESIAQYVEKCHNAGFLCLDIKPDNIFVLPETPEFPMFFDFDSMVSKEEAQKGYNLSFSERWAAPEQLIPGEYSKISEATDIYALGELVFWCVFGRNSRDEEHRDGTCYRYEESLFVTDLSRDISRLFSELFHSTIRVLPRKRYHEIQRLVEQLEKIICALNPSMPRLVTLMPLCLAHFTGREEEINNMDTILKEKHLVILSGIGGIGKSEIVKKYCADTDRYDRLVFFSYGTDIVSTINDSPFITNIEKNEHESSLSFCMRKLETFSGLCCGRTLIVIDSLNEEIEMMENKEVFHQLTSFQCDIIVTTRCKQESYREYQIEIGELNDSDLLHIFQHNCSFESDQMNYVKKIIQRFQRHTLLVELVSKLAHNECLSPENLHEKLMVNGFSAISTSRVKWNISNETVLEHLFELYEFSNVNEYQLEILYSLALMRPDGIEMEAFCAFFGISPDNINNLIDKGWIIEEHGEQRIIRIHAIVAQLVVAKIDKSRYSDRLFLGVIYERINESYEAEGRSWDSFLRWFKTIAEQVLVWKSANLFVANFLTVFSNLCGNFVSDEFELKTICHAISIYDEFYVDSFSDPRERAYYEYVVLLWGNVNSEKRKRIVHEHFESAMKVNCKRWIVQWGRWLDATNDSFMNDKRRWAFTRAKIGLLREKRMLFRYRDDFKVYYEKVATDSNKRSKSFYESDFPVWIDPFDFIDFLLPMIYLPNSIFHQNRISLSDANSIDYVTNVRTILRYYRRRGNPWNCKFSIALAEKHIMENDYGMAIQELRKAQKYTEENYGESKLLLTIKKTIGLLNLINLNLKSALEEFESCVKSEKKLYPESFESQLLFCLSYALNNDVCYSSVKRNSDGAVKVGSIENWDNSSLLDCSVIFDNDICKNDLILARFIRLIVCLKTLKKSSNRKNDLFACSLSLFDDEFMELIDLIREVSDRSKQFVIRGISYKLIAESYYIEGNMQKEKEWTMEANECFKPFLSSNHPIRIACKQHI